MEFNIFAYGTLMFEQVWLAVAGMLHKNKKASLIHLKRMSLRGEVYPVLIAGDKNDRVDGVLFFNINRETLAKLDTFEGPQYERREIEVITIDDKILPACTYILKKEFYHIISEKVWDPEHFEKNQLDLFLGKDL
jgi:gamma-glutamylcyclotransferase (GGCT)/AIG2-like uncharacterized protein YtfP